MELARRLKAAKNVKMRGPTPNEMWGVIETGRLLIGATALPICLVLLTFESVVPLVLPLLGVALVRLLFDPSVFPATVFGEKIAQ